MKDEDREWIVGFIKGISEAVAAFPPHKPHVVAKLRKEAARKFAKKPKGGYQKR